MLHARSVIEAELCSRIRVIQNTYLLPLSTRADSTMPKLPAWWDWDLELSSHLFKRMLDRSFNELDVRRMLSVATGLRPDIFPGRWIVATRLRRSPWEVIVEPDADAQLLVVITAYPVE